jgi:hypothetical protein
VKQFLHVDDVEARNEESANFQKWNWLGASRPPFSKGRCRHLINLPIEKIINSGPRMDFATANLAAEAA